MKEKAINILLSSILSLLSITLLIQLKGVPKEGTHFPGFHYIRTSFLFSPSFYSGVSSKIQRRICHNFRRSTPFIMVHCSCHIYLLHHGHVLYRFLCNNINIVSRGSNDHVTKEIEGYNFLKYIVLHRTYHFTLSFF